MHSHKLNRSVWFITKTIKKDEFCSENKCKRIVSLSSYFVVTVGEIAVEIQIWSQSTNVVSQWQVKVKKQASAASYTITIGVAPVGMIPAWAYVVLFEHQLMLHYYFVELKKKRKVAIAGWGYTCCCVPFIAQERV